MAKDFKAMKPREVEAYLRESVRKLFGDAVENGAEIYSSHGYYIVAFTLPSKRSIDLCNFRKTDAPKIVKALRALK